LSRSRGSWPLFQQVFLDDDAIGSGCGSLQQVPHAVSGVVQHEVEEDEVVAGPSVEEGKSFAGAVELVHGGVKGFALARFDVDAEKVRGLEQFVELETHRSIPRADVEPGATRFDVLGQQ